jgi:signal transduction histidine kinase
MDSIVAPAEDHAPYLVANERRLGLATKWILVALGVLLWRIAEQGPLVGGPPLPLLLYGLSALAFSVLLLWSSWRWPRGTWLLWLSNVLDILFVSYIIMQHVGLAGPLAPLYGLVALKAALTLPGPWAGPLAAALCGPFYISALFLARNSLAFVLDNSFLVRYLALMAVVLGSAFAGGLLAQRRQQLSSLDAALEQQKIDLEQKTQVLQRTATDLGARVLELRALNEMARALSSTLYLEETLQLIVNRLGEVSNSSHCGVALLDADGQSLVAAAASGPESQPFAGLRLPLDDRQYASQSWRGGSLVVTDGAAYDPGGPLRPLREVWNTRTCLVSPLVVRDRLIGVLYLADERPEFVFGEQERQLVASFSYLAATAIENARLYQESWEKSRELEAVLQGIGDGVLVADPQLQLLMMNSVAAHMFSLQPAPRAGMPLADLLPGNPLLEVLESTVQGGQEAIQEIVLGEPGGREQERTYQALVSPLVSEDGRTQGVVAVLRDVTAQKELERMKSNFLSVVSHELKTPLHSIKGFVEIILMGKTGEINELQRDFLGTVRQQTDSLQRQINDLLEFSRLESGQVKLYVEEVALPALVTRVLEKLSPLAQERELSIDNRLPPDFASVEGDRLRLEQVLTNLVENGVKFTPAGGLVAVEGVDLGDHVEVTVCDSGVGVPVTERERIFDRFYQVDSGAARAYRGAGLGLTICKHIVAYHGGRIWVDDNQPQGSRFHVVLPKRLEMQEAALDFTTLPAEGGGR